MYKAYVTKLKNVRQHPNADRMQLADCFSNTVCVGLDAREGDLGVYFPVDGQLSAEFCAQHDLVRRKDEHGNNAGGYLDPEKRNIKAIKLRGEKSDGLFMPISCLEYTGVDMSTLKEGDVVTAINGHEICTKYIPRSNQRHSNSNSKSNKVRKHRVPYAPMFAEHADTEQLVYNLAAFKSGDEVEITLKMHGTSQRTGYLPVLKGYKRTFWDKILRREGTPIYDYDYVTGTRHTVLENFDTAGFYGSNNFRETCAAYFEGKLWKGETAYYEVVGFTDTGASIMADADNKKLNDKAFVKTYGNRTVFSYGCVPDGDGAPQQDFYVYRMTMTNPDGEVVEYSPDFMRYRCELMGIKTVPLFEHFIFDGDASMVQDICEMYYDGPDPVGKTHVREGVVARIVNRPKFTAYKHKNFSFKVLSGIAIADAEASGALEGVDADTLSEL